VRCPAGCCAVFCSAGDFLIAVQQVIFRNVHKLLVDTASSCVIAMFGCALSLLPCFPWCFAVPHLLLCNR
jgi:hypothetical protein